MKTHLHSSESTTESISQTNFLRTASHRTVELFFNDSLALFVGFLDNGSTTSDGIGESVETLSLERIYEWKIGGRKEERGGRKPTKSSR